MKSDKAPKRSVLLLVIILLAVVILGIVLFKVLSPAKSAPEITTVATLEKIVKVENLSTYTAVYNGVATVYNEKKPEKIDYYVSYESTINVGINTREIAISFDEKTKVITITLPDVFITDATVDIRSLDFIFLNSKANTETVSAQAYKACEADLQEEIESLPELLELARQTAINAVKALTQPIVDQLGSSYTLEVK